MSLRTEEFVVFGVMSILVVLFSLTYARDRKKIPGMWMMGWIAILIHFAVPLFDPYLPSSHPISLWIKIATLITAGAFFLLSVSEVFAETTRRIVFALFVGGASLAYLTGMALHVKNPWFFATLLLTSLGYGLVQAFRFYGAKNPYPYFLSLLVPYGMWAAQQAFAGRFSRGLEFYLFGFFAVTGLIYFRHFRRYSPGVLLTSFSFVAWGSVFPVASCLHRYHVGPAPQSVFWDLPKYFVAFGMILTLFENKAAEASGVATRFQALFENNLGAVYVATIEGKLLDCNSSFWKMYGFASKEEALASSVIYECAGPCQRAGFLEALKRDGQVLNYECRHHRKDGTPLWILERASIVADPSGHRLIEGTAIEITERKQAEIALKQSEERFATIFRQSPVGCAILSLDGRFLNVNENLLRMIGRTAEEVIGRNGVDLGFFESVEERQRFLDRLRSHRSLENMDVIFRDSAGKAHEGLYFASLVWIGDKECIFGMLLDQTEQRDLERKFLQAQKMEALGRLAGGVAHDFNNLLGVIGGYAELLEAKLGSDDTCERYCGKILDTTERAGALTRQLLTFSRKEMIRPLPLRPDDTIRDLHGILPRLIGEDIELVLDLRSKGTLVIDKTHFEQIILNIVVNARDAMPGGGQLNITTEDISSPLLSEAGSLAMGHSIAIHIRDTGVGMDATTLAHAFEPFYTTKAVGRGTGLGLSTVYGIVQQNKGDITISSRVGHGTRVSILLPAVAEADSVSPSQLVRPVQKGAGTILIVEDESELRNTNAEFLSSIGYSVICAGSGMEGLEIARAAGKIDLVISDVVMPKMNGREFTDRLLQIRPEIKVLFVSGYADDVILRTGVSMQSTPFLQKPFSLRQLGNLVNELLAVPNSFRQTA